MSHPRSTHSHSVLSTLAPSLAALALSLAACDASNDPDALPLDDELETLDDEVEAFDAELPELEDPDAPAPPDPRGASDLDAGIVLGQTVVVGPDGPIALTYENRDGIAIVDGDIELGPVEDLPEPDDVDLEALDGDAFSVGETDEQGFTPVPIWGQAWANGVVYYVAPDTGSAVLDQRILNQIAVIDSATNFDFVQIPASWSQFLDHIFFTSSFYIAQNTASSDSVGRKGGRQYIRFSAYDVLLGTIPGNGLILHEVSHALGLYHEHQRPDRDDFVLYLPFCVQSGAASNFEKRTGFVWGPYDPGSIMHYTAGAFGTGCNPLTSLTGATLGNPTGTLTTGDIAALNWAAGF